MTQLRVEGSAIDLMLRGHDREAVKEQTGIDIGYHGAALRSATKGVDRLGYKVAHVKQRVANEVVVESLGAYAAGSSKSDVLAILGLAGENIVKLKQLFEQLGYTQTFKEADRQSRKLNMREGMRAKHGVDNPFKLDEYQDQARETRLSRYGGEYTLSATSVLAAQARAALKTRTLDETFASEMTEKRRLTNQQRLGVDAPAQSAEVRARMRATTQARYGVEYWAQLLEAREQQAERARAFAHEWARTAVATCLDRYGVPNWMQTPLAREKQSQVMRAEFYERDAKARITHRERYGVEYPRQRPEDREWLSRFVRENLADFQERSASTSIERYGVPYATQTPEQRLRQSELMSRPEHQSRINAAKRANGTFNSSQPEIDLYSLLVAHFGDSDVKRQYGDSRYPFLCDFYIVSRDLFIELNGLWTHGPHWFDAEDASDRELLQTWASKSTGYYLAAIEQWSVRDVAKRHCARKSKLNYVVFWGRHALRDAESWLTAGAHDARDWV